MHQLSKNVDSFFFRQLIIEIEQELLGTTAAAIMPGRKLSYRPKQRTSGYQDTPPDSLRKQHPKEGSKSNLSLKRNIPLIALHPSKSAISFAAESDSESDEPRKNHDDEDNERMDTLDV